MYVANDQCSFHTAIYFIGTEWVSQALVTEN